MNTITFMTDHKELIFQGSEGSYHVSDVVGYDDQLPALRVLWGQEGQLPSQHANLNEGKRKEDSEGGEEGGPASSS